jgi:hypothetical protein
MNFTVDVDSGSDIAGWLTPDNPSATPSFVILVPGREDVEFRANVDRQDLLELGMHATGHCGFHISEELVPDLGKLPDVEILDAETRISIYRRFQPDFEIDRKIFFFDCSVIPQRHLLSQIKSKFSLSYFNMERHGLETIGAMILNPGNRSIFSSGRINMMRYDHLLRQRDYLRVALLREPHEELAERLYFFNFLAREGEAENYAGFTTGVKGLIEFARDLPFNDARALTGAFRASSEQHRRELMSPMTKVFGCDVDEPPKHANVSRALDNLAQFDVVGTRERFPLFKELLAGVVGQNFLADQEPVVFQSVKTLATILAKIGVVNDLLADDLALYSYVEDAIDEGLTNPNPALQRQI